MPAPRRARGWRGLTEQGAQQREVRQRHLLWRVRIELHQGNPTCLRIPFFPEPAALHGCSSRATLVPVFCLRDCPYECPLTHLVRTSLRIIRRDILSFESKEQVHYRGCGGVKGRMWRGIIRSFFRLYMPLLCFHDEKAVEAEGVVSDDEPSL